MKTIWIRTALCTLAIGLGALSARTCSALAQNQNAQPGPTPVLSVADEVNDLTQKLNLTEKQQAKIRAILEDQRKQAQTAMNGDTLSREDKLSQARSTREAAGSQIRDLLNDEQKIKFDQLEQERRDRMHANRQNGADTSSQ